jgi:hypothetical protein
MMARYRVLAGRADKNSDGVTLVHDGFRPVAFVMPMVWLFWNRLWLHGALMFAVNGFAAWAGLKLGHGASPALLMMTNAALGLITALEGPGWIAARLERNGAAEQGVIMASSLRQAEEICAAHRQPPEVPRAAPGAGFRPVSPSSLIPLTGA